MVAAVIFVEETPSSWVYPKMAPAANVMCMLRHCCQEPAAAAPGQDLAASLARDHSLTGSVMEGQEHISVSASALVML